MGNISEMIVRYQVRDGESAEALVQAEAWANKGLELATAMRKKASKKCEVCEEAYAVLLYNLAVVREVCLPPPCTRCDVLTKLCWSSFRATRTAHASFSARAWSNPRRWVSTRVSNSPIVLSSRSACLRASRRLDPSSLIRTS